MRGGPDDVAGPPLHAVTSSYCDKVFCDSSSAVSVVVVSPSQPPLSPFGDGASRPPARRQSVSPKKAQHVHASTVEHASALRQATFAPFPSDPVRQRATLSANALGGGVEGMQFLNS